MGILTAHKKNTVKNSKEKYERFLLLLIEPMSTLPVVTEIWYKKCFVSSDYKINHGIVSLTNGILN